MYEALELIRRSHPESVSEFVNVWIYLLLTHILLLLVNLTIRVM